MNKLTKILTMILVLASAGISATLFEVKNNAGAVIMEVSDDGIRVFNPTVSTDTIMCISTRSIKANTANYLTGSSGGFIRDFDIADMGNVDKGRGVGKSLMKLSVKPGFGVGGDSAIVYYKPKNAFRVQTIIQDTNLVGQTSFASGYLCEASGEKSTAMGNFTSAKGSHSTSLGYGTVALGDMSTAIGSMTKASGSASTAMGNQTKASGTSSIAMGEYTEASGQYSLASGSDTKATGSSSVAFGMNSIASGTSSTVFGSGSTASGYYSTALGNRTKASGFASTAMGYFTTAEAYSSLVLGRYNKVEGTLNEWVNADPLFVIGNGTDFMNLSNAFEVKKNGNTYIPSLYSTTTSASRTKTVFVDETGKLCVTAKSDDNSNSAEIAQLQRENEELKSRVAKLEDLVEKMLNK